MFSIPVLESTWHLGKPLHNPLFIACGTNKYRLDAEAKGSTVFRIPEDVYKTQGRYPEGFMRSEGILNTVDPIG